MEMTSTLEKIVGPDRVSTSEAVCQSYQFNCFMGKDLRMKPDMVVLAETTEQVSEVLKAANKYKIPVTPKGAVGGGGLGGPRRGGILLDLTLMDKIISIDADNMQAIAEAGCSFYKLSQELFKNGLILPTPSYCNGPNVAASAITPANGYGKTRYGPNIDLVEGFEVVLPSGDITRVGSMAYADTDFGPFYRYITGPDLVGLFTKSNGAFGIVTKVAYQCLHWPKHWAFHSYHWPLEQIENVTRVLMEATAVEMFDVHINDKWRWLWQEQAVIPEDCYFALMFVVNAENEQELKGKEQAVEDICRTHGGTYLPNISKSFHTEWPTVFCTGHYHKQPTSSTVPRGARRPYNFLLDEFIYPTSKLPEVYNKIMELCKKHGLWDLPRVPVFDGYPMKRQVMSSQTWVSIDVNNPHLVEQCHRCRDEFREWYGERGGMFQMKVPPLIPEYCWTNQLGAFNLLKSIKKLLDPNDILSPGTFELGEA
jgi:FAD/FMN-containing dehydrogenase